MLCWCECILASCHDLKEVNNILVPIAKLHICVYIYIFELWIVAEDYWKQQTFFSIVYPWGRNKSTL